jgi:hypothetical protein
MVFGWLQLVASVRAGKHRDIFPAPRIENVGMNSIGMMLRLFELAQNYPKAGGGRE